MVVINMTGQLGSGCMDAWIGEILDWFTYLHRTLRSYFIHSLYSKICNFAFFLSLFLFDSWRVYIFSCLFIYLLSFLICFCYINIFEEFHILLDYTFLFLLYLYLYLLLHLYLYVYLSSHLYSHLFPFWASICCLYWFVWVRYYLIGIGF